MTDPIKFFVERKGQTVYFRSFFFEKDLVRMSYKEWLTFSGGRQLKKFKLYEYSIREGG